MSIVLENKFSTSGQTLVKESAANSSMVRSVLMSLLLVAAVASAGVFAARAFGSFQLPEGLSSTLAILGATVCFTSLPLLVAVYRRQQQAALIGGSVVLFSTVLLAGIIS